MHIVLRAVVIFGRRHGTSLPRYHYTGSTTLGGLSSCNNGTEVSHTNGMQKGEDVVLHQFLRGVFLCFDNNHMPRRDEARIGFSACMATLTRDGSNSREVVMARHRPQNDQDPQMRRSQNDSALGHLPSLKYLQDTSGGDEFALAETFGT